MRLSRASVPGSFQTWRDVRVESAFGGKAEGRISGPPLPFLTKADILARDQRPTRLPPVLGSSSRAKSFTYYVPNFLEGRMIMSAQSSSATDRLLG